MDNKISGILMIVLGVILAILFFALPTLLVYTYWLAVIVLVGYGVYLYQKRINSRYSKYSTLTTS